MQKAVILHVDDNETSRYLLTRMLTRADFTVHEATSGQEALEYVRATPPDLIILDVSLPDISGFEVCRRIKANPETAIIPVLQVSAQFTRGQDKAYGLLGGADGYLTSPVEAEEMIAMVHVLLRMRATEQALRDAQTVLETRVQERTAALNAANQALQDSERQLRALFDSTLDAILVADDQARYVDANPSACELLGVDRAQLLTLSLWDFAPMESAEKAQEMWDDFLRRGTMRGVFSLNRPDGQVCIAEFHARANFLPGRHLSVLRDCTERIRLQEQMIHSAKMASLGQMAAGIAHEINNPLAAASGAMQLLQQHDDIQVREDASAARAMIDRASQIVHSLRSFSRRSATSEVRYRCSLRSVIEGAQQAVAARLRESSVELTLEVADDLPVLLANPVELEQVLISLLVNAAQALQATPEGQRGIELSVMPPRGQELVTITVRDNGPGIPPEALPRIFDPFFTTKDIGQGVGLGLYMSYGIITAHGGTIIARNAPGGGAVFTITLPCAPPLEDPPDA